MVGSECSVALGGTAKMYTVRNKGIEHMFYLCYHSYGYPILVQRVSIEPPTSAEVHPCPRRSPRISMEPGSSP